MTVLLSVPATVAKAISDLLFGADAIEMKLFDLRARQEFMATISR